MPHKFSQGSEEQKIIKTLEHLWPLLPFKYISRLLAKILTSSDTTYNIFPKEIFADDDPK